MHSAKGHIVVDERWRLELALAAACRAFAPRSSEILAPLDLGSKPCALDAAEPHYVSYYSYRYL
ncbi:hypothetical protein KQI08_06550 [Paraeggerthella hongkongensis]|uniref:hypothetical protein n=1 Tax=Paraeggerthella TaxID=651554 RepID=UPI0011C06987|nr:MULTISPECIES: hypothetical protein [Paraeggerthella]MBU5405575.1 hypothetical protein [Paraeggerthella hongkongensis]MCD2432606.1 hypothetical protein [Paraeggerthella hominis]MDY3981257.1 hypothetical protein [Paraeggerthella sp.]